MSGDTVNNGESANGAKRRRRGVHMPPGWQEEKARIAELLDTREKMEKAPPSRSASVPALAARGKPAIFHEQQQFASKHTPTDAATARDQMDMGEEAATEGTASKPQVYQNEFEKFLMQSNEMPDENKEVDPLNDYISQLCNKPVASTSNECEVVMQDCEVEASVELLSEQLDAQTVASLDSLHHEPPFELIEQTVRSHLGTPLMQALTAAMCAQNKMHPNLSLTRFKKAVANLVGEEAIARSEERCRQVLADDDHNSDSVEDTLIASGLTAETADLKKVYSNIEPLEKRGKYTIRMTLFGHTSAVTTVKFSPKGHYILSGGNDGILKIWAVMRGVRRKALAPFKKNGCKLGISDAAFSGDQMQVLVVSDDHDPKIIHWPKARVDKILNAGHTDSPVCCMFSHDSKFAVTGGFDGNLILWDCATSVKHIYHHPYPVLSVDFNPVSDGIFATGCADGVVRVWDVNRKMQPIAQWMCEDSVVGIPSVKFLPRGNLLLTSSEDGHVRLGCLSQGGRSHTVRDYTGHTNSRYYVQCHYDVNSGPARVISGSEDGSLYVWDLASARLVDTLRGHADTAACLDVHPTSPMICSGGYSRDMSVKVWQMLI